MKKNRSAKINKNYWVCVVNRDNWEIVNDANIWGVSETYKNIISKIVKGDKIVFYILKEMVFVGIYEAASKVYIDTSIIFKPIPTDKTEVFPYRIKIMPIKIATEPIPIRSIIPELKFITQKKRWGGHFFGKAMRTIPEVDYSLLNQLMV